MGAHASPRGYEACSDPDDVLVTFSHATLFFETPENTQCFPDGVHAVELNVYDNIGLSDPDAPVFNIQVTTADSLALTITGSGPASTLVNASQVTVSASGLNNVGTTQWVVSAPSTAEEGNTQSVAADQSAIFTFTEEGDYCPVYLSAFDSGGNSGSTAAYASQLTAKFQRTISKRLRPVAPRSSAVSRSRLIQPT